MRFRPARFLAFALSAAIALAKDAPRPWPANAFLPVTAERIAALPDAEQGAFGFSSGSKRIGKRECRV